MFGQPPAPDEHRPERPVLFAVDQELAEGPGLRVTPELADPLGRVEIREAEDVHEFGASGGREGFEALANGATFKAVTGEFESLLREV